MKLYHPPSVLAKSESPALCDMFVGVPIPVPSLDEQGHVVNIDRRIVEDVVDHKQTRSRAPVPFSTTSSEYASVTPEKI